jgi:hypothetical protein
MSCEYECCECGVRVVSVTTSLPPEPPLCGICLQRVAIDRVDQGAEFCEGPQARQGNGGAGARDGERAAPPSSVMNSRLLIR